MEDLLWIELDFDNNNNRVNFYQFKHYPDDNKKSVEEVASKKSQWRISVRFICKEEEIFDIFGIINPCNMLISIAFPFYLMIVRF